MLYEILYELYKIFCIFEVKSINKSLKANIQKKEQQNANQRLVNIVIHSILDKKGKEIVSLDLQNLEDAMTDVFVVCEGNTPVQVRAIAENVIYEVKKQIGELPINREGFQSGEWILIDYFTVVVHIFQKNVRPIYQLEELWADAAITTKHDGDGTMFAI